MSGKTYEVLFDMAGNPGHGGTVTLEVSAAAQTTNYTFNTAGRSETSMGWTPKSFSFTATSASTTLTFKSLTSGTSSCPIFNACGPTLDNIRLLVDTPPTLTVGGTTTFTEHDAPVVVAPGLTLTDPENDDIDGAKVSIGANFNAAQDSLGILGQGGTSGTVDGLSWSYNSSSGVLTLSGSASPSTYQGALRKVTFSNNSHTPTTAARTVTFNIGTQLAFTGNGHFYEFVPGYITWGNANSGAQSKTLYGLQGYLATITSASENSFIKDKVQGNGWLGGSDGGAEGTWKWVTGPEAGTTFCIGTGNCVPQGGAYTNWDAGEPNEAGPEDHVHMLGNPGFGSRIGKWNDLNENYPQNGNLYQPLGYIVEYGGLPGDPSLQLSGDATVNVVAVNDLPTVAANAATVTVDEGDTANNSGTFGDLDSANVAISASRGTVTKTGAANGTWSWSLDTVDGPLETGPVTITANDGDGGIVSVNFQLNVNNVAPSLTVNAGSNTVYWVNWTSADPAGGTASGVITLPGGHTVGVEFRAVEPGGAPGTFFGGGTQLSCGADVWRAIPPSASAYISTEVPTSPPNCQMLALVGTNDTIYTVTMSEPIVNPIMAIVSLGSAGNPATYAFDTAFTLLSQGPGNWGGGPASLTPDGLQLHGREGNGTLKFLQTTNTFSWTVPDTEVYHGFTFAIRSTAALGNTDVAEGDTATNTGTWSDPGVNDNVVLSASVGTVIKNGDGTWSWSFVTTDGPPQTQTVTITATDKDGASTFETFQLKVNNVAPVISSVTNNGPVVIGASAVVIVSATDVAGPADPLQYEFDFDNNGTFEVGPQAGASAAHTYPTLGTFTVNVRVTDGDGGVATGSTQVEVINTPPTVDAASASVSTDESTDAANSGTYDDVDPGQTVTITASVGTVTKTGTGSGTWSWTNAAPDGPDSYPVTITADDGNGGSASTTFTVTVNNVAPTVVVSGTDNLDEGDSATYTASVSDVGILDTHTILWDCDGDGFDDGSGLSTTCSFPDGDASVTVSAQATDNNGGVGTGSLVVTVHNVDPVVTATGDSINEGSSATVSASFTDAGVLDTHTATINWGDGSPTESVVVTQGAGSGSLTASHVYVDNGNYTVAITVTDSDTGVGATTTTVVVNNVNPVVSATGDSIDEGGSATVSASFTDVGLPDTHTATIDWGDGSSESVTVTQGAGSGSLSASHTYGDNGSYTVTVTVTDDDGGVGTATATVEVSNIAPTLTLDTSGAVTLPSGVQVFLGTKGIAQSHDASATDPGSDDLTFVWGFGSTNTVFNDGSGPDPLPSPGGTFPFAGTSTGSVTFAAAGLYTIDVTVTDDDGGSDSASLGKLVQDDCDCTMSQGFWKNEFKKSLDGKGKNKIDDATLATYLGIVVFASSHFDEHVALSGIADAHNVFNPTKGNNDGSGKGSKAPSGTTPSNGKKKKGSAGGSNSASGSGSNGDKDREKATQQTLAAWLNFAKGSIGWTELVDTNGDGIADTTFGDLINEVETILNNPDATKAELEHAKDLAEAVNQHDKNNPDCDTGSGSGAGSVSGSGSNNDSDNGSKADSASGSGSGKGSKAGSSDGKSDKKGADDKSDKSDKKDDKSDKNDKSDKKDDKSNQKDDKKSKK